MLGYVIIALGVGLMISSYFVGWNPSGWRVFLACMGAIGVSLIYLSGY